MDRIATEEAVRLLLSAIRVRLHKANRIAETAEACARAGSVAEGVSVAMQATQLVYEAGRLQDAASLLNRIAQDRDA